MSKGVLPTHVGIIMDGNGRWAVRQNKKRTEGHKAGAKNVELITNVAFSMGIKTITLFAFSSENWKRPKEEVELLFGLLKKYFKTHIKKIIKNKIKLNVMGDLEGLPEDVREIIKKQMEETKDFNDHVLNIALNYGGRAEIVKAVKTALEKGEEITEESISKNLYTYDFGEPELIIRTSGEKRLSNFMLYQSAYSEFYFTDVLWPDFNEECFKKAIDDYMNRDRRFGNINA
ncbi:MAG: isoprenyl transferase [Clostridiales bacterium]|nr:isoprenyl transferase [Clostridiales bacterium]